MTITAPAPTIEPKTEETAPTPEGVSCQIFRPDRAPEDAKDLSQISEILKEKDVVVWFDVVDPKPDDLNLVVKEFGLHPLAVEDAVQAHQRPKIESYDTYWFLILLGTTLSGLEVVLHEMAIFASTKFLVTVRHQPPYPIQQIRDRWNAHPEQHKYGGGFLLYAILDSMVDGYLPVAEAIQDRADDLEEGLFDQKVRNQEILQEIFQMKQEGRKFRHAVLPMRDILNPIIRGDLEFPREVIVYFRDVYDHTIIVIDQLDTVRDMVNSALEIHLSVVANKQNEVAKQLTIIATIFLPLTFIVGFFGQNFAFMVNHIVGAGAFWVLGIGAEVVTIVATVLFFKIRGWF